MTKDHRKIFALVLVIASVGASGCAHQVTFQDAHYQIGAKQQAANVVAVIDQATLNNKVEIRSWMAGIANGWEVEPGDMLKQVVDIELPQMFAAYEFSTNDKEPSGTGPGLILRFTIPNYTFSDFHANVSVAVMAKARAGRLLFEKTYSAEGDTQGGKMFWGGAFAMKSAIRQSSLDAYKKIFVQLRTDLEVQMSQQVVTSR